MKKLYKVKVEKTETGKLEEVRCEYGEGWCVNLQSIFYSEKSPQHYLHLFDADGDEFMFSIPGQARPTVVTPDEVPVTVKLPLYYLDTGGGNELILWGEVYRLDRTLSFDSKF